MLDPGSLKKTIRPAFPRLENAERCDVCVIGSDLAALTAALMLAEAGADVLLLEQKRVFTVERSYHSGHILTVPQAMFEAMYKRSPERAGHMYYAFEDAKYTIGDLLEKYDIDCQPKQGVLHVCRTPKHATTLDRHFDFLASTYQHSGGEKLETLTLAELLGNERYENGWLDQSAGSYDPGLLKLGLTRAACTSGVGLYENTSVLSVQRHGDAFDVETPIGAVNASFVILNDDRLLRAMDKHAQLHLMPRKTHHFVTTPLPDEREYPSPYTYGVVDHCRPFLGWRPEATGRLVYSAAETPLPFLHKALRGKDRLLKTTAPSGVSLKSDQAWISRSATTSTGFPYCRHIAGGWIGLGGFNPANASLGPFIGKLAAERIMGKSKVLDVFAAMHGRRHQNAYLDEALTRLDMAKAFVQGF
jgi:gamma-glutamylputrescine oxidase